MELTCPEFFLFALCKSSLLLKLAFCGRLRATCICSRPLRGRCDVAPNVQSADTSQRGRFGRSDAHDQSHRERWRSATADEIFEQLQKVISGHASGAVLQVLLDSLSATLAFMVDHVAEADAMIDTLPADMKADVRRVWSYARKRRAVSPGQVSRVVH